MGACRHLRLAPVGETGSPKGRRGAGFARRVGNVAGAVRPARQNLNFLDKASLAGLMARDCPPDARNS